MYPNRALRSNSPPLKGLVGSLWLLLLVLGLGRALPTVSDASAEGCANTVVADVVVLDQPLMFNRLGAQNVNSMVYALQRDVIAVNPSTREPTGDLPGTNLQPGAVELRPDKRPRPLVLRVNAGDCLQVNFTNLLASAANPNTGLATHENLEIDDQVADRMAGFHPQGMQLVGGIDSDSSFVGQNANSLVAPGDSRTYTFLAPPREGTFLVTSHGATFGGEATGGNLGNGMFAAINVEPPGADYFRSQVTEEELRLATQKDSEGNLLTTADGHPLVDYDALYPNVEPWTSEGKAGLPVLRMTTLTGARGTLVHSDINAIIAHRSDGGSLGNFPPSTYPLESQGKRNPTVPNRLEPFREFTSVFHDEVAVAQAFPGWFEDEVLSHTLHGVRDGFMINYGSGGIGSEIIANRLGVGPMHDCLHCTYEEFFLASSTVGDPAMLVDVPANDGLEALGPGQAPSPGTTGPKAHRALYPDDPANVHHSYTNDFTKIRNLHAGPKEHHIFHLHNHQWLFNANDDNANYLDAQGLGPGSGYTYEINFGGSGNRNKTAGDAIYHCHFYPHFAQGMWYLWRNHDVFEAGTRLAVTGNPNDPQAFHTTSFALSDGTPALVADLDNNGTLDARARALPDGEILAGTPIPALVPLPGKPMAPLPGRVMVVTKDADGNGSPDSSQAKVDRDDKYTSGSLAGQIKNPGYPFWIAGIEHTVGQRPPNPPLDMLTESEAEALNNSGNPLWSKMSTAVAGGWNGGLPRLSLEGYLAGGESLDIQNRLDFSKEVLKGKPVYYPEEGTDVEQAAMAFHAQRCHGTFLPDGSVANCVDTNGDGRGDSGGFITNGAPPVPSAPYHDPCIDDEGDRFLTGQPGQFFSVNGLGTTATPEYGADNPRVYKAANIQLDVVLNKVGYHFPQQRIITLWEDVDDTLNKVRPPEPFVMRLNTFDCAKYLHTNLVPHIYELDDYQVRTDTDVIGQHIHLPKWDLTSADGSGNGWNYEDGTLSPGTVREEIEAINCYNGTGPCPEGIAPGPAPVATLPQPNGTGGGLTQLEARPHPFFGDGGWLGARTTIQRWFADPVVNVAGVDRGLGIIFTHDHFGPSTHQQVGLYSTLLIEPARSTWVHNETGEPLGTRHDGGPTSWQAAILTGDLNGDGKNDSYREFYFEYSDFQHAYEAGFGADGNGNPVPPTEESFRHAINPSVRQEADPVFPDLVLYPPVCPGGVPRPCPEAISADDPGMFVVNYRNEPVGLRVFDPNKAGPDGKLGSQADGLPGDLAFALQTRTDRKIGALNTPLGNTPYPSLNAGIGPGDPFTPMIRGYVGDTIRVKVQAGGDEETHLASIHGVKWLQGGSGFGAAPNSGWRNAQQAGISEQFTFAAPVLPFIGRTVPQTDYAYSVDTSSDGWWSGMWGLMRVYNDRRNDLYQIPGTQVPVYISNLKEFISNTGGICLTKNARLRTYDLTAVLANNALGNPLGVTIPDNANPKDNVGGGLKPNGGTLVYNPRTTELSHGKSGPLHDPTAILYVRTADLDTMTGKLKPGVPLEPLVIRATAGECILITLRNKLPGDLNLNKVYDDNPDLANLTSLLGVVNRHQVSPDPQGLTTFNNNLIRPSSYVGLHPQLVAYDITRSDGANVGTNPVQTVPPGGVRQYLWYAGEFALEGSTLVARPIELGGSNLIPADKIKQGQKGLVGALVIEPSGTAWKEDASRRTAATVGMDTNNNRILDPGEPELFRDFVVMHQKGVNLRYKDGSAVESIAGEGGAVAEDSEDSGQMAINYGTEPMWFRFGLPPSAPFGGGHGGGASLAEIPNAHEAYSNSLAGVGGDPATPVFTAAAGRAARMRVLFPTGVARASAFTLHGHPWQRDPYICPGSADLGLAGKCPPTGVVGSQAIGDNPLGFYLGGQESILPYQHFDIVLPSAGGALKQPGDYLFRDQGSFGNTNGLWGILRVTP